MPIFTPDKQKEKKTDSGIKGAYPNWLVAGTWGIAALMTALMVFALVQYFSGRSLLAFVQSFTRPTSSALESSALPDYEPQKGFEAVKRGAEPDTVLPSGSRKGILEYEVATGDSLFGIAERYDLEPESVLWANDRILNDDPHLISPGVSLRIPPVDGILYEWKEGDKLDHIAGLYKITVDDILLYPGNNLDITNPVIEPGTLIMLPGAKREFRTWVVPVVAGDNAGVTAQIAGPGSCSPGGGAIGSYAFSWPTAYGAQVSGNDYWGGHQALDFMCYEGDGIFASDSGVVIYAGPISGGYGNLVAIDHRNGYLTLYAHLSAINVGCGQSVAKGTVIGACGSTGNSTGAHLHFEVRQNGAFINPWHVLN